MWGGSSNKKLRSPYMAPEKSEITAPNFDTAKTTSIKRICSFPKKHTLLSQDTIDKPRSMITMIEFHEFHVS